MKNTIQEKLDKIEKILESDISLLALFSLEKKEENDDIINEVSKINKELAIIYQYSDIRFGEIEFWTEEDLFNEKQFNKLFYGVPQPEDWICIGEVQPYPLLFNKKTGIVNCVISEPGLECEIKEYVKLEQFIDEFVLGKRYFELGIDDEWYEFMEKNEII
ncbi:hypothetical protein [Clostridium estertheticum]|uniref:SMI1/KNR4 family protein n=1 Tax=Clostridium estertheticum subsp. estertheticum TaxID=1552 RepID=A0A1J0GG45_9CLOT|nr:hypothetical protein [Clostridium estertheticum]APC40329.1 hypothetical protein A7L45_09760 [Clostridium estertheticum subsp. estertheticum]MBU3174291.1 hypothetical protein [Clostridium estertheticum]MBZ9617854.1 hypothetical protein [Clostridium estertheticum subsp. laramiense]WAG73518.1 hypothetical protein LL032_20715 [Clostridium estertheticum]